MLIRKKYAGLKKALLVFLFITMSFFLYVMIVNIHSKNMTTRQKILKAVYPALIWLTNKTGQKSSVHSNPGVPPLVSFYSLTALGIDGKKLDLNDYRGKKILLVNTASDCGYTGQYEDLEKLYQAHKEKLVVLGFPANDFKEQEKKSDIEIASFCKLNFGVTFPLLKKSKVTKGPGQNEIFQWLTNKNNNGWNDHAPSWNFCKYLVDEHGVLRHFFSTSIEPTSSAILNAIAEY